MDTKTISSMAHLSNHELLARVKYLAQREREATATLVAHLAELDERRLYLGEGCSSLFMYCTQVLHLSEHAAYGRIEAARLIRKFPVVLEMLEDGSVNLTTAGILAAHLTCENHRDVLEKARHRSKREVEMLVVRLHPQPPLPSSVRRLPIASHTVASHPAPDEADAGVPPAENGPGVGSPTGPDPAPTPPRARPAVIAPLAPQRYKVQFTASAEMYAKLRLAQDLLRHQIPDGDPAAILDRALTVLLEDLAKKKLAATDNPRAPRDGAATRSRHIPAEVKRAVWLRDGSRCAFIGHNGRRCSERGFLEFHHVTPYAAGGQATVDNIQLRCRAHNGYEAELDFGQCTQSFVREPQPANVSPDPAARGFFPFGLRNHMQLGPDRVGELGHRPPLSLAPSPE